jgi:hypothetical protein
MWLLQKYMGKKTLEGEEGYDTDYGYLPPIEEEGVDNIFATWWEPALGYSSGEGSEDEPAKKILDEEDGKAILEDTEPLSKEVEA